MNIISRDFILFEILILSTIVLTSIDGCKPSDMSNQFDEDKGDFVQKNYYIEDVRLIDQHLYCKFFTGQCGLGLEAIAFEYFDFREGKWHFITYGTELSEFVGDSIMADIAWITKEGTNSFDTEVADSIKWIKME